MPNAISRDSPLIRNASDAVVSFCAKHPLLALITTVALSIIAVIGLTYRKDTQLEQAFLECVKNGNLKRAEALASKIYFRSIRDKVYERLSKAYRKTYDTLNAERVAQRITNPDLKERTLQAIRIQ